MGKTSNALVFSVKTLSPNARWIHRTMPWTSGLVRTWTGPQGSLENGYLRENLTRIALQRSKDYTGICDARHETRRKRGLGMQPLPKRKKHVHKNPGVLGEKILNALIAPCVLCWLCWFGLCSVCCVRLGWFSAVTTCLCHHGFLVCEVKLILFHCRIHRGCSPWMVCVYTRVCV